MSFNPIGTVVTSFFKGLFSAILAPLLEWFKDLFLIKVGSDEQVKADVTKELSNVEEANRINATIESKSSTDLDRLLCSKPQPPNDNQK